MLLDENDDSSMIHAEGTLVDIAATADGCTIMHVTRNSVIPRPMLLCIHSNASRRSMLGACDHTTTLTMPGVTHNTLTKNNETGSSNLLNSIVVLTLVLLSLPLQSTQQASSELSAAPSAEPSSPSLKSSFPPAFSSSGSCVSESALACCCAAMLSLLTAVSAAFCDLRVQ
jgi:hypothetical protein